jgi:3-oxoacyl-[acyl-carrier-protein] synthase II
VRRAAISGVGVVSAFGVGARAFFDGLANGRAAVGPIRSFDVSTFPVRVAGEVPELPLFVNPHRIRDRKMALGLFAAREAWRDAGCDAPERGAALVAAVGLEQALLDDFAPLLDDAGRIDWPRAATAALPPVAFRAPIDATVRAIADVLRLTGPTVAHVSACAAGALAVAHAAALIERGDHDVVFAGGTDSMINPLGLGGMARLGAPSPRHAPDACRPFDRRRDGLAMGEGAAFFVIENEDRARARGARVYATVDGYGSTCDAYHRVQMDPDGDQIVRAMQLAIGRSGHALEDIGYVNYHGTSTVLNDAVEARCIRRLFGRRAEQVPGSSTKSMIGHPQGASGAAGIVTAALALRDGFLPPTINHTDPDPACDVDVIPNTGREAIPAAVLCNCLGFGSKNSALVLGHADV